MICFRLTHGDAALLAASNTNMLSVRPEVDQETLEAFSLAGRCLHLNTRLCRYQPY